MPLLQMIVAKRRMKKPLSSKSMAQPSQMPAKQGQSNTNNKISHLNSSSSKLLVLSLSLLVLHHSTSTAECASVIGSNRNSEGSHAPQQQQRQQPHHLTNYRFFDRHNEYDSGVSILDDDTLRLSLAIDDDSSGLSAPSLRILEPKVYLRVSGESGMIRPDQVNTQRQNEVVAVIRASRQRSKGSRRIPSRPKADLQFHRESTRTRDEPEEEEQVEEEDDEDEEDNNENYHHLPYIESYREKYVRPDPSQFPVTTPSTPTSKSPRQEWSDIIAQVTTPSSFNEINSSASEHRLADYHLRTNLPSYYYNKYSSYSEEDLENVADLDDDHSKYFVKTRPRSVTTAGSNIYSNFYYEPPSFSTKSVPIPVKTNKEKVVFASFRPTQNPNHFNEHEEEIHHDHDEELPQQDTPIMTTISHNFTAMRGIPTHPPPQITYHVKEDRTSQESVLKTSASSSPSSNPNQNLHNYFKNEGNLKHSASTSNNNHNPYLKSSAETLDVSTSQSILSKVTVNNPHLHHHPQFVIIKSDPYYAKTAPVGTVAATPHSQSNNHNDEITLTSIKIASSEDNEDHNDPNTDSDSITTASVPTTTESPITDSSTKTTTQPSITASTTTDESSIPGIPGVDYPTLGEIPQTSFDCKNQRYKGFFADIDAKCQAWHYCDFTDGHSTFLCPNGTLFSQVLLTCDWWFNVDCHQARQLYVLNERLYRYIKPPKPSFPEDFIGEHVDKWLIQQFANGYLPKVRKKSKAKLVNLPPPTTTTEPPTPKEN